MVKFVRLAQRDIDHGEGRPLSLILADQERYHDWMLDIVAVELRGTNLRSRTRATLRKRFIVAALMRGNPVGLPAIAAKKGRLFILGPFIWLLV